MDVAIVTIGEAFNPATDKLHSKAASMNGVKQIQPQPDGSQYNAHYLLTTTGEAINIMVMIFKWAAFYIMLRKI